MAPPGPGRGQPSSGAFADQVAFELGQSRDMEHELAARGRGVDRLLEARNPITAVGQAGHGVDQMPQRAAGLIDFQAASVAGTQLVQELLEGEAVRAPLAVSVNTR